jgi:hypothetical protein
MFSACGLLIIAGVGVLAKLLITRKTQTCRGRQTHPHPQGACFHTCSGKLVSNSAIYSIILSEFENKKITVRELHVMYIYSHFVGEFILQ